MKAQQRYSDPFDVGQDPTAFLHRIGAAAESDSGVVVTDRTALSVMAVLSCVKVISEAVAGLPLSIFERQANGDRTPVDDHPLAELLHDLPNVETTAMSLRETKCAHVLLRGNARTRIVRDGRGDVRELWTIPPDCIVPRRPKPDGPLVYDVSINGLAPETLRADQIWNVPGLSWNGVTGLSPIGLARESLGVAIALERSTSAAMKNGARVGTIISYTEKLEQEEYDKRYADFQEQFSGPDKTSRTFFADGGAKAERIGMTFADLQFIDLKRYSLAEICRLFRVPRHMVFDIDTQPRANMEQSALEFVVFTLAPWLVRFEQSIYRDLLLPSERKRYFAEHNVAGLLRGDFAARMAGYEKARVGGWLSVNDIRRLENMNRIDGDHGDDYAAPLNSSPKPADGGGAAAAAN